MKKFTIEYKDGKIGVSKWVLNKLKNVEKDSTTENKMSETDVEEMIENQKKRIDKIFNYIIDIEFQEKKELERYYYSRGLFPHLLSEEEHENRRKTLICEKCKLIIKQLEKYQRTLTRKKNILFKFFLKMSENIDFSVKVFPECIIYLQNVYDEIYEKIKENKKIYEDIVNEGYQIIRNKEVEVWEYERQETNKKL